MSNSLLMTTEDFNSMNAFLAEQNEIMQALQETMNLIKGLEEI